MFSRAKHDNETSSFCYKFCFQGITQLVNHRKSRGQSLLIPLTKITIENNMSTCPFLSAAGRQKSADGRIQVRRCRKSRKQSHRLFGTQGTQKRERTETFPGLAKLSLRGICPLGCVMEIARNPEKKWIDLQRENCLSWKGNLMFNNMQVFSVRWKEEEKGRGYGITAVFFHSRRRPT